MPGEIIQTKVLTPEQSAQINQLWNDEFPAQLKDRFPLLLLDVDSYDHFLIEDANQKVMAWVVVFQQAQQTRFSLIVAANQRNKGLATLLINQLKGTNPVFYGWVIDHEQDLKSNGAPYPSPLAFYEKLGFEILANVRLDTEMIKAVMIKWDENR
jgi:GNAT superfamily N-acetyltransferase